MNVDTTTCTHANDIGVTCSTTAITSSVHQSQLVIIYDLDSKNNPPINVSISSGILGIFFHMPTRPGVLCGEDFDKKAADTACRQLRYMYKCQLFQYLPSVNKADFLGCWTQLQGPITAVSIIVLTKCHTTESLI